MGILSKVKRVLNIGRLNIALHTSPTVQRSEGFIEGRLFITSESTEIVKDIKLTLTEEWEITKNDEVLKKSFIIGKLEIENSFKLLANSTEEMDFKLPFDFVNSDDEPRDNENSVFKLRASVGLEGSLINCHREKIIQLT